MTTQVNRSGHAAGAFDVRLIIAMLFAIYGAVLVGMGVLATSEEDIAKAAGTNINLWSGIGMLVFAALFTAWARLRPIIVPDAPDAEEPSEQP
ncbi:hypothetical protein GIY23_18005 [Allosaccharopolyspora coralli]|uniref:Uncharacterized protein n=1 Tax=Allosaccharopolyspora coralli TaxID=2665642 RepID=A0A5Q3QBD0_9PSEU|nr:hypothetical protein [Allosaccharopolyspora coralli]QGK71160.1 hypothetical protein GIY23_18005 [Allosaccharopolyspora coralli]